MLGEAQPARARSKQAFSSGTRRVAPGVAAGTGIWRKLRGEMCSGAIASSGTSGSLCRAARLGEGEEGLGTGEAKAGRKSFKGYIKALSKCWRLGELS